MDLAIEEPTGPVESELENFWWAAKKQLTASALGDDYEARCIGLNNETTEQILELILAGDKTGTFTLPWIVSKADRASPKVGDTIILVDFSGRPRLLVRLTAVEEVPFGAITEEHIAVDGPPVRSLNVWKPLHTQYWNRMLEPFDLSVSDDMPVLIEKFELLYRSS